MGRPANKLTDKQQRFVDRYLVHGNGTQAAIEAGYSPQHAARIAWQLLNKSPAVAKALEAGRQALKDADGMEAGEVRRRYTNIARGTIGDVVDWTGDTLTIKSKSELTEAQIEAIEEISPVVCKIDGVETIRFRVKMHSKLNALRALAAMAGIATKREEHDHKGLTPITRVTLVEHVDPPIDPPALTPALTPAPTPAKK